jgi:hypothetical protein
MSRSHTTAIAATFIAAMWWVGPLAAPVVAQETFLRDYGVGKALDYFLEKHGEAMRNLGYSPFYPPIPGPTSRDMHPPLPSDPDALDKLERKGRTG